MRNGLRASSSAATGRKAVDHHRHRGPRRLAQVVAADRVHANAPKIRATARSSRGVPTRIAPCRSAVTRSIDAEPLGGRAVAGDHLGVHLGGDVDQRQCRPAPRVRTMAAIRAAKRRAAATARECAGHRSVSPPAPGRGRPARGRAPRSVTVSAGRNAQARACRSRARARARPGAAGAMTSSRTSADWAACTAHISPRPRTSVTALLPVGQRGADRPAGARPARAARCDQPVGLDDLEDAPRPHHVGEVAAPGGVDPRRDGEHVVGHLVDPAAGHDAADLRLLAERDDVRAARRAAGRPTPCRSCRRRSAPRR